MNWLDMVILILLLVSAIGGLVNGLIKAVISLVGLIVGIVLAGHYYVSLAGHLTFISDQNIARIASFVIIFLAVSIVAAILGTLFTKIVSSISLGWLNRLGGAAFGILIGAVFIAAILSLWVKFAGGTGAISSSVLAPLLVSKFPLVLALLPSEFNSVQQFFH
jgi:membrane protein required for colicin V production